jgi:translation initiation factor IF-2
MSKVRVYEVAKQLNMDQKTLVALFQSMGIGDVRNHMSAVESDVVERVKRHLERQKAPEVVEERIRPTVVKRRARGSEGETPAGKPEARSEGAEPARVPAPAAAAAHAPAAHAPATPAARAAAPAAPAPAPVAPTPVAVAPPPTPAPAAEPAPEPVKAAAPIEAPPAVAPVPEPVKKVEEAPKPVATAEAAPAAPAPKAAEPAPTPHAPAPAPVAAVEPKPAPVAAAPVEAAPAPKAAEPEKKVEAAPAPKAAEPEKVEAAPAPAPKAAEPEKKVEEAPKPVAAAPAEAAPAPKAAEPEKKAAPAPAPKAAEPEKKAEAAPKPAAPVAAAQKPAATPPAAQHQQKPAGQAPSAQQQRPATSPPAQQRPTGPTNRPGAPPASAAGPNRPVTGAPPPRGPASSVPPPRRPSETPSTVPPRPSSPPKTGIDVWQGRPGVPMPQAPRTGGAPPARRTTYDPRANAPQARPGTGFGPPGRPGGPQGNRPGGPGGRPGFRQRPGGPMQQQRRGPVQVSTLEMASHKKVVKIEEQVSLQQLAAKMSVKATDVLMKLLSMGMTGVNINSTLDADTAKIIASEFGWSVEDVAVSETQTLEDATRGDLSEADMDFEIRPPIVTVMGHVDHGKTSLLDRIRKASVAEGEAGGITQHIGAYRVETPRGTIAFLDTPGHEAFTAMRARGASVTDIVILVVAADDGVMPQTREAISHAQAAKVPIIVAVNKIDKPGCDPEKVKRDLATLGLQPEEWGGDTMFVHVSAKTGQGIDQLLESAILQSEVLELKAYPKRRATGTVIEALLDRGRGPVARVMIQDGTLRTGDIIIAGSAWGKVRAMTDELGRSVGTAGPSTPVEVLGINEVPSAGDPVHAVKDAKTAEEIAEGRRKKASKTLIPQDSRVSLEALTSRLAESEQLELKLIIKGDVQGSVEAIGHALAKLSTQKVKVTIVHAAVGGITEGDVNLAVASKAIIVGFNVRPAGKAASHAETEGVEIRLYNIIYNAVDDIRAAMEGLLPATKVEKLLGKVEVRQVFRIAKSGTVAGCMVTSGLIKRTAEARLIRDSVVVWTGKLSGLRRFKDDVKEVAEGFECGISLENYQDIKEKDVIESFEIEEVKTKLS